MFKMDKFTETYLKIINEERAIVSEDTMRKI